jgi:hypothetical protein
MNELKVRLNISPIQKQVPAVTVVDIVCCVRCT